VISSLPEARYPAWAPGLRAPAPGPYMAYRSAWKRRAARALDALGAPLAPAKRPLPWGDLRRVAVLRLDHLGDLLLSFPALEALRRGLPHAHLTLVVAPWCEELARLCPWVDAVSVARAPWFERPRRRGWPVGALGALAGLLRRGGFDLGVDLRGDLRHMLAMRWAGVPWRLAAPQTAGGFLLTHAGVPGPGHEWRRSLDLLKSAGLRAAAPGRPRLAPSARARAKARRRLKGWGLRPGFLAVHPFAGAPSKRWPLEHWRRLLAAMPRRRVLLLGGAGEAAELQDLAREGAAGTRVVAAGTLGADELAAVLEQAGVLLGLDSGPGHLAAAVGTPVLSLFSAASDPARWGAQGPGVRLLSADAPCSPCGLVDCPLDNACMRALDPQRVLAALRRMP
jgi:ADP-heptose:LPS heptosyltransferase